LPLLSFDQRPVLYRFEGLLALILAIAQLPSTRFLTQVKWWGVTRAVVADGNQGDRPLGIFARK